MMISNCKLNSLNISSICGDIKSSAGLGGTGPAGKKYKLLIPSTGAI